MIVYAQGDITKFDVDAIVNASNGFVVLKTCKFADFDI